MMSPHYTHYTHLGSARLWQDYDWSTLQRAFGGIKQAWYTTQQVVPDAVLPAPGPQELWCLSMGCTDLIY